MSGSVSEEMTFRVIKKTLTDYGEIVCPHTAVGLAVSNDLLKKGNFVPMVTLATAHPAKFPDSVEGCTNLVPKLPAEYKDLFSRYEVSLSVKNNFNEIKEIILKRVRD